MKGHRPIMGAGLRREPGERSGASRSRDTEQGRSARGIPWRAATNVWNGRDMLG